MRHITLITVAVLILAACQKEVPAPEPQPQLDIASTTSLAGTSWAGSFDDSYHGYPATITGSIDFLTDSTGTIHFELVIAAQSQPSMDVNFTYTFDGREGTYIGDNMSDSSHFTYNATNRTITMELMVGDGSATLGGTTVLYPQGSQPVIFPVNTSWETEQQLLVCDTLMLVEWGLDFWDYGWGGQINYCANGTCCGTSMLWQYDSTTHTGSIRINGSLHPFSYDPATEILTLDYSTSIYGTNVTIGGELQFHRENETKP